MVFTSTGATGPEMDIALKALALRLADKSKEEPSHGVGIVRARFAFANARSALIWLEKSVVLGKSLHRDPGGPSGNRVPQGRTQPPGLVPRTRTDHLTDCHVGPFSAEM